MTIKIISEEQDIKAYYALLRHAVSEESQFFRIASSDLDNEVFPTGNSHESFTLGAFSEEGILQGTVGFKREILSKLKHKGLIFRMYVASGAKGTGMGRKLLKAAIEHAKKSESLKQIYLTLVASNERAKNLYLSEGFEIFSLEKNSIQMSENEFVDEASMILHL